MMFKHIDIPVDIFVKELPEIPAFDPIYRHIRLGLSDLSPEYVEWMKSIGLTPDSWINPLLFYAHPGTRTSVHSDQGGPLWSMNILLGEGDIEMQWRKAERGGERKNDDLNYIKYSDDLPIIESTKLGRTLCRIGVPHASFNHGPGVWILSLRASPLRWAELIDRFP